MIQLGEGGCQYYLDRFGVQLPADMISVCFGHMLDAERRATAKPEDLASSVLSTINIVLGSIIALNIKCLPVPVENIIFAGSYFRDNSQAVAQLSAQIAMMCRDSKTRACFLEHDGFSGAVGTLVEHLQLLDHVTTFEKLKVDSPDAPTQPNA